MEKYQKDVIQSSLNYMFQKHVINTIQYAYYMFSCELHILGTYYIIQGNYYMFCFPSGIFSDLKDYNK